MQNMTRDNRFVGFVILATIAYLGVEYAIHQRELFNRWYADFSAPFTKHPGRKEWLRETLLREEHTIRPSVTAGTTDDCGGCDDA
jgi:hypothetical protein